MRKIRDEGKFFKSEGLKGEKLGWVFAKDSMPGGPEEGEELGRGRASLK